MKTNSKKYLATIGFMIATIMFFTPEITNAQRMGHSPARGGGGGNRAASRPAPSQQNRSINGGSARPAPTHRPTPTQRPSNRPQARPAQRPSTQPQTKPAQRPSNQPQTRPVQKPANNSQTRPTQRPSNQAQTRPSQNPSGGRNNINIDNSRNVNVNRNVVVRPPYRPYPRPPHYYGGFHYNCFHPYRYHPYRPHYWGPMWHPWGFFVATIAATAIIVSVQNQQYYYDTGVYYIQSSGGYTVIEAPVGATIKVLPEGSETVVINETTNNYYYGGTYYEKDDDGYTVVPPTAGTVVENLPEGGEEVKIGDITYVVIGDVYYQPIEQDGEYMYEVVEVKEAEES